MSLVGGGTEGGWDLRAAERGSKDEVPGTAMEEAVDCRTV